MMREDIPARKYITEFADWENAFRAIQELPYGNKKKLIVIDEFPYMCKANGSIPSILQNLWDTELKDSNIMIILCGSAMSFIEKELLAENNPLYGRATGIYKMKPMGFYDAVKFLPKYTPKEKIIAYSVLGGIPHYLKQFDPNMTLGQNIKNNIITKGSILYSEVEFLLHQELRETSIYNTIIEAVALGNTKLGDICQKAMIDSTSKASVYLRNLIELGIVEREFSVGARLKEKGNGNRGLYRITDNFFKFWYTFGFANFSQLEDGDVDGVYRYAIEPALHEFASFAFEDVCKEFIKEQQKSNALPFRYSKLGRWFGKTTVRDENEASGLRIAETEIDLLAIDQDGKNYLIGECKFRNQDFKYSEYLNTLAKLTPQKNTAKFHYALFAENGFDKKIVEETRKNDCLHLYNLDDIINLSEKSHI